MKLSRRNFALAALSLGAPRLVMAQDAGGVVLTAEKTTMPILGKGAPRTPAWRFLKDQPISILRAKQGQLLKGRIVNLLDQDIWLHWFGVRGPSAQMTLNVLPGETNAVDFAFTPPDAGTFWFGPMAHASEQRDMGLYGMLIVEEQPALPFSLNDIPIIIDDWLLDDQGKHSGKFGDLDMAISEGRIGNWFTVNGSYKPRIKYELGKPTRLRILNAANAQSMKLSFKGTDPLIVALDGQPIAPKQLEQYVLILAAGQRADLLVSETAYEIALVLDTSADSIDVAFLIPQGTTSDVKVPESFKLPNNPLTALSELVAARHVKIVIEGGAKGGLKAAKFGDQDLDLRGLLEHGLAWAFNAIAGVGGPPLFEAKLGETLIIDFENKTSFPQPIHIHGHVWQMIESDGQAIALPNWMDTAIIPGLSSAKLAFVADNPGLWVLQSLVAERVDSGLIGAFSVLTSG